MYVAPKYREALPEEYPQIIGFIKNIFKDNKTGHFKDYLVIEEIFKNSRPSDFHSLVGISNGKIVAFALLTKSKMGDVLGASITPIAVSPEFQNQGVGTNLIQILEERVKRFKGKYICLFGQPGFFGRLGYYSADLYGIERPRMTMPLEKCLIKELQPGYLKGLKNKNMNFLDPFDEIYTDEDFEI